MAKIFQIICIVALFFCLLNVVSYLFSSSACEGLSCDTVRTTTWKTKDYSITLREGATRVVLEAVAKQTKYAWATAEITKEMAAKIVELPSEDPLHTLVEMITDAFNKKGDVKYIITSKGPVLEITISVVFYKRPKDIVLVLTTKEVTDIFRLEQIISDQQDEIAALERRRVLYGHSAGPFTNPSGPHSVAKIDNLPKGTWLIELTFQVTSPNEGGWIYYQLLMGEKILSNIDSRYIPPTPYQNNNNYNNNYNNIYNNNGGYAVTTTNNNISISERYVEECPGGVPLYIKVIQAGKKQNDNAWLNEELSRGTKTQTLVVPNIVNVILTATPL